MWRRGTKCDCKHDRVWVRFLLEEMEYLIYLFSANTRRLVPTLNTQCLHNSADNGVWSVLTLAGYGVKLKKIIKKTFLRCYNNININYVVTTTSDDCHNYT